MKTAIKGLALASMVLMSSGSAFAGVSVKYLEPEKYSDLPFSSWERKDVLDELTEHFQKLSEALPPGVDLNVEIGADAVERFRQAFSGRERQVIVSGTRVVEGDLNALFGQAVVELRQHICVH
mgnify:CR=1 FL=1